MPVRYTKKMSVATTYYCPHCGYRHLPDGVCVDHQEELESGDLLTKAIEEHLAETPAAPDPAEKNDTPLPIQCPECGEPTVSGFGLAGGGYGEYVYCGCGFVDKRQEVTDDGEVE